MCTRTPNRAELKNKTSYISCTRTGARPARAAHAPLSEALTDSAKNTATVTIINLSPVPYGCMFLFHKVLSSTQRH